MKYFLTNKNSNETVGFLKKNPKTDLTFLDKKKDFLINWGNSKSFKTWILNKPEAVATAVNKIKCLNSLMSWDMPIPHWSTNASLAKCWVQDGLIVMGRNLIKSNGGNGIVVMLKPEDFNPNCKFYTQYILPKREYRVHVFMGKVIHLQEKKQRTVFAGVRNKYIRSHQYGWLFVNKNVVVPQDAQDVAVKAVQVLGLDFGALDMVEDMNGKKYILEVNTAPGLEPCFLEKYLNAFEHIQTQA